jgi:hypothetical protein
MQHNYEIVVTDKDKNKYVAFICVSRHGALRGIDRAITELEKEQTK